MSTSQFNLQSPSKVRSFAQQLTAEADRLEEQGRAIVRLLLGQPATGAPLEAIHQMAQRAEGDPMGYTNALGIRPLREKIAALYQSRYGIELPYQRVAVTMGASLGLIVALLVCFPKGAKIALPYPAYPAQKSTMELLGYQPVAIYTKRENNFQVTLQDLQELKESVDGLLVSSPSNPTGAIVLPEELKAITHYCQAQQITLLSDEIYHGIAYPGSPSVVSALEFDSEAIIINSFSKYFSMPGWRVGWMIAPERLIETIGNTMRNLYLSTPTPSQYVALAAMEGKKRYEDYVANYEKNRVIMREGLLKAGFSDFVDPQGAFYYYVNISHRSDSAETFCWQLLQEQGVAIMPGEAFDPKRGHQWVRLSYAAKPEAVQEAMQRLANFSK